MKSIYDYQVYISMSQVVLLYLVCWTLLMSIKSIRTPLQTLTRQQGLQVVSVVDVKSIDNWVIKQHFSLFYREGIINGKQTA